MTLRNALCLWLLAAACGLAWPALASALLAEGDKLPAFVMDPPVDPQVAEELGVAPGLPFSLEQMGAEVVLLEVLGVYCPQCQHQLPGFNSLYNRIKRAGLLGRVKMLGLAAGGTPMEVNYLRTKGGYAFPVVPDPEFRAHKALGEPLTPFTLLVDRSGTVRYAHLGVIQDTDGVLARIRELLK